MKRVLAGIVATTAAALISIPFVQHSDVRPEAPVVETALSVAAPSDNSDLRDLQLFQRASRSRPVASPKAVVAHPVAKKPVAKPVVRPKKVSQPKVVAQPSRSVPQILARIRGCESGNGPNGPGNYTAQNRHSSASGAYQFLDGTWRSVTGLSGRAMDYPPATQDAAAVKLYRSSGTSPWRSSRSCWG